MITKKPTPRVGMCKLCAGVITEEYIWINHTPIRYGGPLNGFYKSSGLSCQECGIMYAKLPKPDDDKSYKTGETIIKAC